MTQNPIIVFGSDNRPQSELASHYFDASLPAQFDAYAWFAETHAVTPLPTTAGDGAPETFGL